MHYLYLITNGKNGKVYVGQTKDPNKRKYQHKIYSTNKHLRNAITKYGWGSFVFEEIACCKTQEYTDETEVLLIKQYDSRNPEKGYNVSPGGFHTEMSIETRKRISESSKGRHNSPDTEFKIGSKPKHIKPGKRLNTGRTHFAKGHKPYNKGLTKEKQPNFHNAEGNIKELHSQGFSTQEIADKLGVRRAHIYSRLSCMKLKSNRKL